MRARRNADRRRRARASTSEILGPSPATPHRIPEKWRRHYKRLNSLRDHFLRNQAALACDALSERPSYSTHMADAGTDAFDRDFALGMLSTEQDTIYQIEQAIDRIQNGTYGVCEITGKRISPQRLEAIPWTRFGLEAERRLEGERARPRARIGPRETVVHEPVTTTYDQKD